MRFLRPPSKPATLVLFTLCMLALSGCSGASHRSGELSIQSRSNPDTPTLAGFSHGIYSLEGKSTLTVLLTDGPVDSPRRALIVRMFWRPKAASTPLDETATNATVQYIVFGTDPEHGDGGAPSVGIYSGGGFLYPETDPGTPNLQANLWQATLSLADASDGFDDTLGPSILTGKFSARRDEDALPDAVRKINIAVTGALGAPRFVTAE